MSLITTMKCDGEKCGKLRVNDTNHWLKGMLFRDFVLVANASVDISEYDFEHQIDHDDPKHFCGEQCANKWVSQQIGNLKR